MVKKRRLNNSEGEFEFECDNKKGKLFNSDRKMIYNL